MNKSEQVSSDHHQMSLTEGRGWGSPGLMAKAGEGRGYLLCDLSHDEFDVTYPMNRMTDRCL